MLSYDLENPLNQVQNIYSHYSSSSGTKEYDNSFDATEEIEEIVKTVRDSVTPDTPFSEKVRAIGVILEISNQIVEGDNSTLGSEIRKQLYFPEIGAAVTRIVDMLLPEELGALQADGQLADEMISARKTAKDYALDVELDGVIGKIAMEDYMSEHEDEDMGEDNEDNKR
jgi:hypothetical protein